MARSAHNVYGTEDVNSNCFSSPSPISDKLSLDHEQRAAHCPICVKNFNEPRRLQCDHIFCRTCLNLIFEQQQRERTELYCPICQQQLKLPPSGVDGLDSVIFVYSLGEIFPNNGGILSSSVKCSRCNETRCLNCVRVVCNNCEHSFALRVCTVCHTYMCERCTDDHLTTHIRHSTISIEKDMENKRREVYSVQLVAQMSDEWLVVKKTPQEEQDEGVPWPNA